MPDKRPAPPVPPSLDLRGFQFMPLDVLRLRDSNIAALASGNEFRAAVLLWCAAWHQMPASSLPNDDRILARLSGAGDAWADVKAMALHGFKECRDGRLYHAVIAEKAIEAGERQERSAQERATNRKRQQRWRDRKEQLEQQTGNGSHNDDDRVMSPSPNRYVTALKGQDREKKAKREKEKGKEKEKSTAADAAALASLPDSSSLHGALENGNNDTAGRAATELQDVQEPDIPFGKPSAQPYNGTSMDELLASNGIGPGSVSTRTMPNEASFTTPGGQRIDIKRPKGVDEPWPERVT